MRLLRNRLNIESSLSSSAGKNGRMMRIKDMKNCNISKKKIGLEPTSIKSASLLKIKYLLNPELFYYTYETMSIVIPLI